MIEIVPIINNSDGDASARPPAPEAGKPAWRTVLPPTLYLEKIAGLWMISRNSVRPGVGYYLDRLPAGYVLYERERPSNPKHIDRHLYGHPSGFFFRSPNDFFPHFQFLMGGENGSGCVCSICAKNPVPAGQRRVTADFRPRQQQKKPDMRSTLVVIPPTAPIPLSQSLSAAILQPKQQPRHAIRLDEEQTRDEIRVLLDKLKREGKIDQSINELTSIDWQAERSLLPAYLREIAKQKAWIPRVGEIVLFVRGIAGEICYDTSKKQYKIYSTEGKCQGHPEWEAGVVGQVPSEPLTLQDLLYETNKKSQVAYSGFRIEPLPDVNSKNKSYTKQYKYIPMHHIRPFVFWEELTRGIDKAKFHPTIANALKITSSVSLVERFHICGKWPKATVTCQGIFVGPELICVGDAVRLIPATPATRVSDVLCVTAIKLNFSNLDNASGNDYDDGHPYNTIIRLAGKCYTLDPSRGTAGTPLSRDEVRRKCHASMSGYDNWYPTHESNQSLEVSYTRVLGRCYEAEPMLIWLPFSTSMQPDLDQGCSGMQTARIFSTEKDRRIKSGRTWYWGDSRAETLGIESLNGVDVSFHDNDRRERTLPLWKTALKSKEKASKMAEPAQTDFYVDPRAPKMSTSRSAMVKSVQMSHEELRQVAGLDPTTDDSESRQSQEAGGMTSDGRSESDMEPQCKRARQNPATPDALQEFLKPVATQAGVLR